MGTTVVKRGAGRPNAAAKKSRHDQRTPLPPKGAVRDPRETRERSAKVADDVGGCSRAVVFIAFAREHDWWAAMKYDQENDRTTVTCKRDDGRYKETITAEWESSRVPEGGVNYSVVGGRSVRLRNVSAARQHIDGSNPVDRDAPERKSRSSATRVVIGDDGEEVIVGSKAVAAESLGTFYHVQCRSPKGRAKIVDGMSLPDINTGPFPKSQADKLTASWTADGYEVVLIDHHPNPGPCAGCSPTIRKVAAKIATKKVAKKRA